MECLECGGGRVPFGNNWIPCKTCAGIREELEAVKAEKRELEHRQECIEAYFNGAEFKTLLKGGGE